MTLQEQYNQIKQGKGSKQIFLTEAKKQFSDMLTNPMGFDEASKILKTRGVISENYIDLHPISTMEATPKTSYEIKFAEFLAESSQIYYLVKNRDTGKNEVRSGSKTTNKSITGTYRFKTREEAEAKAEELNSKSIKEAKAVEKKTTKEVDEINAHSFDYKDKSNLDNQIGQEVLNGIYFEAKQNPDKDLEEIRKMVSKNLEKDGQYYMKNAAFGVEGLGYQEAEVEEVSGAHKASGYSDKLKKMVKESLLKNPIKEISSERGYNSLQDIMNKHGVDQEFINTYLLNTDELSPEEMEDLDYVEDRIMAHLSHEDGYDDFGNRLTENKKPKKETVDSKLAEIDKQGLVVALEAKIDTIEEMIKAKNERLSMVSEDENLAELVDKQAIKGMQKEIKLLEKKKAAMEKMYEKMCGKSYTKTEVVGESRDEEDDREDDELSPEELANKYAGSPFRENK